MRDKVQNEMTKALVTVQEYREKYADELEAEKKEAEKRMKQEKEEKRLADLE